MDGGRWSCTYDLAASAEEEAVEGALASISERLWRPVGSSLRQQNQTQQRQRQGARLQGLQAGPAGGAGGAGGARGARGAREPLSVCSGQEPLPFLRFPTLSHTFPSFVYTFQCFPMILPPPPAPPYQLHSESYRSSTGALREPYRHRTRTLQIVSIGGYVFS